MDFIKVVHKGVPYNIPYRVYGSFSLKQVQSSTCFESLALMSRYHSGYVRELAAERLLLLFPIESVPYIVQLLSEYVVEISQCIARNIPACYTWEMREFLKENPFYAKKVRSRIASYWDCYDRKVYPNLVQSPAFYLLFCNRFVL